MLFKQLQLLGIKEGSISVAFRKWKSARVKKGTLVKTSVGQIEIQDITQINPEEISDQDASNAGYHQLTDLINLLGTKEDGVVYKIKIKYHSEDPRIELRNTSQISDEEYNDLKFRLSRFDKYSKNGNWTLDVLQAIRDFPKLRAKDLAVKTGKEKGWLKLNIRKLKNMGLTISHPQGYSISPRGHTFLNRRLSN